MKVSLNENPDFMEILSYSILPPSPIPFFLIKRSVCVYMFYEKSHLEFHNYCALQHSCILGWTKD